MKKLKKLVAMGVVLGLMEGSSMCICSWKNIDTASKENITDKVEKKVTSESNKPADKSKTRMLMKIKHL